MEEDLDSVDNQDPAETKLLHDYGDFSSFKNSNRINISFDNIVFMVRKHMLTFEKKEVLHGVSGKFKAGELTAIMGPSGAGKSCLMNILSSYITGKDVTGEIKINGKPRDISSFRRYSAYIMQDDHVHKQMTVIECMFVAAQLKLSGSHQFKIERVQFIMKLMGLEKVGMTFTQNLSGGQRKRLVIAFELIGDSSIMFFDEPTSHLDSVTARQCIEMLKLLAQGGRTIICTIHQPSATLFNMFDHLYVVAKGNCVYDGRIPNLLPFLESQGFHCPTYHNPSDFVIDVASGEFGDQTEKLTDAAKNMYDQNQIIQDEDDQEVKTPDTSNQRIEVKGSPSSFWTQYSVLVFSDLVRLYRNRDLPLAIILSHVGMAAFLGCLYWDIGKDANRMNDNAKLCFFNMIYISFCAISSSLQAFPDEIDTLQRESFNTWYTLPALYLAKKTTYMIASTTCSVLYILILFLLTNQLFELDRFCLVLLQDLLIALISLTVGMGFAAGLPPELSTFLGIYSLMPQLLISGLYVRKRDALSWLQKLYDFSIFKNAFEGIMLATYGYDRERLYCHEICDNTSPKLILAEYDMQDADYWWNTAYLIGFYLAVNFNCYSIVWLRLKR